MQKFNKLTSIPAYLPIVNIDTDMIIPKQFLKTIKRTGLGKNLFFEMRYENEKILKDFILKNNFIYNFLLNKWYFDELYNFIFVEPIKRAGTFFWKKGDINTIDRYGPDGLSRLIKIISTKAVNFQSGYLYHYAFVMLIGFSLLLTFLILV